MKVGLSTYSLVKAINAGEMDLLEAIQWIADNGGEHVEFCPAGYSFSETPELIETAVSKAGEVGLDCSSYTIGANFIKDTEEAYRTEIDRVKSEVDIAGKLGVKFMRHDAGGRPIPEATLENFEKDLPRVADACREVAEHAEQYGITTSVENHGYHFQGSERVARLVKAVDRENFRTLIDIGNFLCVDEDPYSAVQNNLPIASFIHMKDFYVRDSVPCDGFFKSAHGRSLRGAVVGTGDVDVPGIIKLIKESGYDNYISIEFEGWEDCRTGSKIGMANVRKLWDES